MNPFLTSKKKLLELLFLGVGLIVILIVWPSVDTAMLFCLGFIWNWTASQEILYAFDNRKYRFSLLKMVFTLQSLFIFPFKNLPEITKLIPRILPAGIFWCLVIWFVQAQMPWWTTFIGSLVFELTQIQRYVQVRPK